MYASLEAMTDTAEHLISLRPGGVSGINPFAAFSQGAGVKAVQQKVRAALGAILGSLVEETCSKPAPSVHAPLTHHLTDFHGCLTFFWLESCCIAGLGLAQFARTSGRVLQVVAPSSGTAHQQIIEERKKEQGVDVLKYSAAFMLQFSEVRLQITTPALLCSRVSCFVAACLFHA